MLLAGCRKKEKVAVDPRSVTDTLAVKFTDSLRMETRLLPESVKVTQGSEEYAALSQDLQTLNHSEIGAVKTEIDAWIETAQQLREKFRNANTNKAINARLTIVYTKANVLKQELDKRVVDTAKINQEATELYNAFQDLGFQFNLKFGKSVDELLEDFRKENQKRRIEVQEEKAREAESDTTTNPEKP